MICHISVPPGITVHKPPRRALICQVSSSPTVVTDHQGSHAIPAHVTQLLAVPTYNISITTATTTTNTGTPISKNIAFWTLSSHVPRYIAQIADGLIRTITCQVTCLPTIVARFLISAVSRKMALLIAVVAESQVPWWQWGSCAVSSTMSTLAAGVADSLIRAIASHVPWFPAVPA